MKYQNVDNLRGEIEFRKKLSEQHVSGKILLPDYYKKEEHDKILLERVNTTLRDLNKLANSTSFSPFIELGAERCQRSLVLTNDFRARGFAVDISYHQLKTAEHFAEFFDRPTLPFRICCDCNKLPFQSNIFSFAFCYQFIRHFPDPIPIISEINRVLSTGTFFFGEEPFKRPKLILYKKRNKVYSDSYMQRNKYLRFIENYIAENYCDERGHGILENDNISLKEWRIALSVFNKRKVSLSSRSDRVRSELGDRITLKNSLNMILGGEIEGVCIKSETDNPRQDAVNMEDFLICPNCMEKNENGLITKPRLIKNPDSLACTICGTVYSAINGIQFLLPTELFRELYPEFAI
jgi:SAM-dependent methyltransferase/uncharacterized protein YbaR (Trm112 family)